MNQADFRLAGLESKCPEIGQSLIRFRGLQEKQDRQEGE
jgi:hypothetical protein